MLLNREIKTEYLEQLVEISLYTPHGRVDRLMVEYDNRLTLGYTPNETIKYLKDKYPRKGGKKHD